MTKLAAVIQGETGGLLCGAEAMLIIAWMIARGAGPWYGNAEPGLTASLVARWYWLLPDPLPDAWYTFSTQDLQTRSVQAIVGNRTRADPCAKCGLALSHNYSGPMPECEITSESSAAIWEGKQ